MTDRKSGSPVTVSAGTLLYRYRVDVLEVLLVRTSSRTGRELPWGIPKGRPHEGEPLVEAARRETLEETGVIAPDELIALGSVEARRTRKTVHGFAGLVGEDCRPACASWEIDRAEFVTLAEARRLIRPSQAPLIDRLELLLAETGG